MKLKIIYIVLMKCAVTNVCRKVYNRQMFLFIFEQLKQKQYSKEQD